MFDVVDPATEQVGFRVAEAAQADVAAADRAACAALVGDARVEKVSFTGSNATGLGIAAACACRLARVTFELGGKSAALILGDYDLERAAGTLAGAARRLSGQVCYATTRLIVERRRHDAFVQALAAAFGSTRVGDRFDPACEMGPVLSARQRDRIEGYLARGRADSARLGSGGGRPAHLDRGFSIEPAVFADVDNRSVIAQEEIFGPVLPVIAAHGEKDALAKANETVYGLNASVYTDDVQRAYAVARRLRSGTVGHNGPRTEVTNAFGGFKQSGIGREGGAEGLRAFLGPKTVLLDATPQQLG